ncbi:MAG TPA: glycoside hydrolase family 9 protein, partial [Halanaerobiales bacterium]|nr:glycoside hydrolase family 9 protein [Halanaerobiales bacterium]
LLYELKGEKLNDFSLDIPEAENLPDFLVELKYELDWMLKMQDEDGGVYHKVNTINFPGMIFPDDDNQMRYIYEKGTTDTAIFAGAMACAYRAFKDIKPEYSAKLAEAAIKAGEFLLNNDVMWPSNDNTGEYKSSSLVDELYWAYAELFRLTGRKDFYEEAELMNQLIDGIPPFSWDDTTLLAIHAMIKAEDTPDKLRGKLETLILSEARKIVKRVEDNGYWVALDDSEYYWASNKVTLAHGLSLILANELYPDRDFIDAARRQLDYILGINSISKSFITDIGTDRVRYPHHRLIQAGGKIVPGLMVGGPNDNAEDGLYQQGLKQGGYVDMFEAYSCNEYAIDYNAPLVFLAGYFMDEQL